MTVPEYWGAAYTFGILGMICNRIVIRANGGRMPVSGYSPEQFAQIATLNYVHDAKVQSGLFRRFRKVRSGRHIWVATPSEAQYPWLIDRFWGMSIGDLFLYLAMIMLAAPSMITIEWQLLNWMHGQNLPVPFFH